MFKFILIILNTYLLYKQYSFFWSPLQYSNTGISFQKFLHIFTTDVFPFMFHFYVSTNWKSNVSNFESTYKKCLREEWGKFTGYQLLSSFWLKVARTDEDGNTTRWDRGTLPIRNLYPKWGMLRFGRMRKVTNWIWILWFIVSYWWVT